MFNQSVIEKLQHYVYFLQDPRNNEVFYVGKGTGNRVFQHLNCAIETDGQTEKLDRIRGIVSSGFEVKHQILRHGLSHAEAFEIEASLIDFIGMTNLTNIQNGHYSSDYGIKTADEISAMYEAQVLSTSLPALLININKLYRRDITDKELYDATRMSWVLGKRREHAQFAPSLPLVDFGFKILKPSACLMKSQVLAVFFDRTKYSFLKPNKSVPKE